MRVPCELCDVGWEMEMNNTVCPQCGYDPTETVAKINRAHRSKNPIDPACALELHVRYCHSNGHDFEAQAREIARRVRERSERLANG